MPRIDAGEISRVPAEALLNVQVLEHPPYAVGQCPSDGTLADGHVGHTHTRTTGYGRDFGP
ncbi:MAG TPA: hypothetical protein VGJ84_08075 [Polyangiaceae bacterium]